MLKTLYYMGLQVDFYRNFCVLTYGCSRPIHSVNYECRLWHYDVEPAMGNYYPLTNVAIGISIFGDYIMNSSKEIVCPHCGSVGDYSKSKQTFKDGSVHLRADCNNCGRFIDWIQQSDKPKTFIPFGKYKGKHTYQVSDLSYLKWLYGKVSDERLKLGIKQRLTELTSGVHG